MMSSQRKQQAPGQSQRIGLRGNDRVSSTYIWYISQCANNRITTSALLHFTGAAFDVARPGLRAYVRRRWCGAVALWRLSAVATREARLGAWPTPLQGWCLGLWRCGKQGQRPTFDETTTHHAARQLALQPGRHSAAVDDDQVSFCRPCLRGPWGHGKTNKTTCRVPLNDDKQEKANRRHAQLKRDSMRASATPNRNRRSLASQDSPRTPAMDQDIDMPDVTGTGVTPMKRAVPLLANFEEWNKLASDNVRA